jgi:formamidopyrimidine-DNA glycosylase
MPELPEVQTVLEGFATAIEGKQILSLDCFYPGTVIYDASLPDNPLPAKMLSYQRRGKYMLVNLDTGCSLIIHLRMTGKLVIGQAWQGGANSDLPQPNRNSASLLLHERARFMLGSGEAVHFIDPRTFGKIVLCRTQYLHAFMPQLGMEPLDKGFTPAKLMEAIKNKKAPIKNVLLDQRIVAGLGNIYVCEILFRTGINPTTHAGLLKHKAVARLVKETVDVLSEAINMGGTSISDFRRIDDKTGEFQHFLRVYQKQNCPLGHKVERVVIAGRGTFYCPECQK